MRVWTLTLLRVFFTVLLSLPLLPIIQFHNMKWYNKSSQNLLVRYTKERALPITLHLPIHKSNVCSKLCHIVFAQFCLADKWQWTETPNKLKYWEIEFKMFDKIRQASTSDQNAFGMERGIETTAVAQVYKNTRWKENEKIEKEKSNGPTELRSNWHH